jgi:cyclic pyranopterin phosphate synthase
VPARAARLSHLDAAGRARMVDISDKPVTAREAVARGRIDIAPAAMRLARAGALPKGGLEEVARLAGILAAKRTAEAIPLCHPLPLTHVDVLLRPRRGGFEIEARVRTDARTGAEMEALHAVAVAALTVYDMVKAADKKMTISDIRLVRKTGGRSGTYVRRR